MIIVGAGIIGMTTAHEALRRRYDVTLLDASAEELSISWDGTRMIRDEESADGSLGNTGAWRRLLEEIGYGEIEIKGITHLFGSSQPLLAKPRLPNPNMKIEANAFVVDTTRIKERLLKVLYQYSNFSFETGTRIHTVDPAKDCILTVNGKALRSDITIIAAGIHTSNILRNVAALPVQLRVQVCAALRADSLWGGSTGMPAFIQHESNQGLWGTPAVGFHPSKISASDLCFHSIADARRFTSSALMTARFVRRIQDILPGIHVSDVSHWMYGVYPETTGSPIYERGNLRAHLACGGGGFKRAPRIAAQLLSNM